MVGRGDRPLDHPPARLSVPRCGRRPHEERPEVVTRESTRFLEPRGRAGRWAAAARGSCHGTGSEGHESPGPAPALAPASVGPPTHTCRAPTGSGHRSTRPSHVAWVWRSVKPPTPVRAGVGRSHRPVPGAALIRRRGRRRARALQPNRRESREDRDRRGGDGAALGPRAAPRRVRLGRQRPDRRRAGRAGAARFRGAPPGCSTRRRLVAGWVRPGRGCRDFRKPRIGRVIPGREPSVGRDARPIPPPNRPPAGNRR